MTSYYKPQFGYSYIKTYILCRYLTQQLFLDFSCEGRWCWQWAWYLHRQSCLSPSADKWTGLATARQNKHIT